MSTPPEDGNRDCFRNIVIVLCQETRRCEILISQNNPAEGSNILGWDAQRQCVHIPEDLKLQTERWTWVRKNIIPERMSQ